MTVPDLPWSRMRQPDQRTCGPSTLVAARMLLDPAYAEDVRRSPDTRFGADVLDTHRRATRTIVAGRLQVPWPRPLGTPPWALARELSVLAGPGLPARRYGWHLALLGPGGAFDRVAAAVDGGRPAALYVGNAWLPRHVVLATDRSGDDRLGVYDPARGARVEVSRTSVEAGALTFGRWDRLWFDVTP